MPDYGDSGGFQGAGGGEAATGGMGMGYGPSSETSVNAGEKQEAMQVTEPTKIGLSPGQASAMFGNQLGPQLAGMEIFGSVDKAEQLANRIITGQLGMMANEIDNDLIKALAYGPISYALNELGKLSAKNVLEQIIKGATPVYDSQGNITGAKTDAQGLIAGYDVNRAPPDADGSKEGTFTSKPSTTAVEEPTPLAGTGASAMTTAYSGKKGPQDSSGSGRRSLFGRKLR